MSETSFPPGPRPRWWGGNFKAYRRDPLGFLTMCARTYGDIVGMRYYNYRTYFLNHPDFIEAVLVTHNRKFIKGRALRANRRLLGNGLLTSEGDFWLRQRRLAQPSFHRARVAAYAETMVRYTERMLEGWRDADARDVHQEMMRLTLGIVAKTLFDADVEGDARDVGEALEVVMEQNTDLRRLVFTPAWLPTPANFRMFRARRRLDAVIYRIIAGRRASGRDTGDLLSMLLAAQDEDGSRMTDLQLRDEAVTLFLAGHETTALALSWAWWLLAQHPEAERKLQEELSAVLGGRSPTMEDLPRLRYAEMVLNESMRLYPPAWGMVRMAIEDCEIGGYPVPRGTGIAISQFVTHRDARWFDAPEEFRPERWGNDFAKGLPRFAYFPFGGGPRQCIGNSFAMMEAMLLLATIAQRFRLRLVPGHRVEPMPSITLRPKYGIHVTLEARREAAMPATAAD
jgi:cytochrome P450